jgi:hypothetical protein
MKNKTCGECKHFEVDVVAATCEKKLWICDDNAPACDEFEPKPATNGDVIRQMSNEELAQAFGFPCPPKIKKKCRPFNEECFECWLNYLNAPAKEGEDE